MESIDYKRNFGEMLRIHREHHNYTQEEFASKLSMHISYYGKVERGENHIGLEKMIKVSKVLGHPLSHVFKMVESFD